MKTQSQPPKRNKEKVYQWIDEYQKDPGNKVAQEKLVQVYNGLIESLARKYSKGRSLHEDLVQVGMIGLLAAIRRYDKEHGKNFESFAVPTIIGEMKRFIRDKTWSVHVPRRIKETGPKIRKAVEYLTNENQRSPQVNEIAEYLNLSEEEILESMEMGRSYQALSVDSKIEADSDGSTVTLLDLVGNRDEGFENTDLKILLKRVFHVLTEREKEIINLTFFEQNSQKEAGEKLEISQMHVSRLQRRALKKLREAIQLDPQEVLND